MKGEKFHLKKQIIPVLLGLSLWGIVAWLFIDAPLVVVNAMPRLLPLAVFSFLLFLTGLLLLTGVLLSCVRSRGRRFSWLVILLASSIVVLYNLSPLAPAWSCFGKRLYVATVNAAGQNCTEKCTNWDAKACSGWSSCYGKFISCSDTGRDQDGRICLGCCYSCVVVCDPIPTPDQPPTISSSIACSQWGSNGWCVGTETLNLSASDPQNYTLTITGSIGGTPFTCAVGKTCSRTLPDGSGTISYTVIASPSGQSASGSTSWKRDSSSPDLIQNIPSPTGSNGWFNTVPVVISATSSDSLSGLVSTQVSVNGGPWQSTASLDLDGVYKVDFRAEDNAGNTVTSTNTISIDTAPPAFTVTTDGLEGISPWYVSFATTTIFPSDALSGVANVEYSENEGSWRLGSSLVSEDGVHSISIRVYDVAGNVASGSTSVSVDTISPSITPIVSGTNGSNGWIVSMATVSATVDDVTSGVASGTDISVDAGASWQGAPISLSGGVYGLVFRAVDAAGNVGTTSQNVHIDATDPDLGFVFTGTRGLNGWYVSDVNVSTSASDASSGVDYSEMRVNGGSWAIQQTVSDGVHDLDAHARDLAGNIKTTSSVLRIDTRAPVSTYTSHNNKEVVSGTVKLGGLSLDEISGMQAVDISTDGGATWNATDFSAGAWSYDWNTTALQNGSYTVKIRGTDVSGNREESKPLILLVDNIPPQVNITNSWWIWDSGEITVSANNFIVGKIMVTISDPDGRWPAIEIIYSPDVTAANVTWDRRFSDGTIAPSGNYHVTVLACDIYDNCARDRGVIVIPFIALIPPTTMPFPLSSPTSIPSVTVAPTQYVQPTASQALSNVPATPQSILSDVSEPQTPIFTTLAVLSLIALMWVLSSAALADPRPKAILAIAKTLSQKKNR